MYTFNLTEEEIAVILNALGHFQYNNPYVTPEAYDIAENVRTKIDEIL